MTYVTPDELGEAQALAQADVLVAASDGAAPAPGLVLRALNAQVVVLASRLPVYEEALDLGAYGLLFEPRDIDTLAAQLQKLVDDPALRHGLTERPRRFASSSPGRASPTSSRRSTPA